jgi:outer membrane protein TolC
MLLVAVTATGCGSTRPGVILQDSHSASSTEANPVARATFLTPVAARDGDQSSLSLDGLIADVLARNPNLAQMTAAWQAASARYPQVRSLDDPTLGAMFAPASFGSSSVESGYRIEIAQKIPFPGKLHLKGQAALSEAGAAHNDVEDMRVQLIESAKLAFYEYYLIDRASAVNNEGLKLLGEFKQNAEARYKTGLAPQQDILQAEVEIGRQRERAVTLERMRKVAMARINTLRSLPPDEPLPNPPRDLKVSAGLPAVSRLREVALAQRPDLKALQDRIAAEESALKLAWRDYYPDVEVMAAYDTIMGNGPTRDLAAQVGVRMNLPIRTAKRNAAVAEAQAKIAQRHAEYASRVNQIQFQVQEAYEQLLESERVLALYAKTILPAARENVKAAQTAYVTGKTPFLSLIEAQRNLVNLREREYEATADYFRRQATLERAIGAPLAESLREQSLKR